MDTGGSAPIETSSDTVSMNNFYLLLMPNSDYRNPTPPGVVKLIKAIDTLLQTEFKDLEISRILKEIMIREREFKTAFDLSRQTNQNIAEIFKMPTTAAKLEAGKKAREELRPLFKRLHDIGFSLEELAR